MNAMQKRYEELTVMIEEQLTKLRRKSKDPALPAAERQKAKQTLDRYQIMLREQRQAVNGGKD